jgi:hypothetical protein
MITFPYGRMNELSLKTFSLSPSVTSSTLNLSEGHSFIWQVLFYVTLKKCDVIKVAEYQRGG